MEKKQALLMVIKEGNIEQEYTDMAYIAMKLLQNYELLRQKTKDIKRVKETYYYNGYKTIGFKWSNGIIETFHNIPTKGVLIDVDTILNDIK